MIIYEHHRLGYSPITELLIRLRICQQIPNNINSTANVATNMIYPSHHLVEKCFGEELSFEKKHAGTIYTRMQWR